MSTRVKSLPLMHTSGVEVPPPAIIAKAGSMKVYHTSPIFSMCPIYLLLYQHFVNLAHCLIIKVTESDTFASKNSITEGARGSARQHTGIRGGTKESILQCINENLESLWSLAVRPPAIDINK
jgi:hypothetical protein